MDKPTNKKLNISAISVFVLSTFGLFWYNVYQEGNLGASALLYATVNALTFMVAMYMGEKRPGIATLSNALISAVYDYVTTKDIDKAMEQLRIIIVNAVHLDDKLRQMWNAGVKAAEDMVESLSIKAKESVAKTLTAVATNVIKPAAAAAPAAPKPPT